MISQTASTRPRSSATLNCSRTSGAVRRIMYPGVAALVFFSIGLPSSRSNEGLVANSTAATAVGSVLLTSAASEAGFAGIDEQQRAANHRNSNQDSAIRRLFAHSWLTGQPGGLEGARKPASRIPSLFEVAGSVTNCREFGPSRMLARLVTMLAERSSNLHNLVTINDVTLLCHARTRELYQ